ncbi:hypothetical protein [Halobellus sp. H-GB7]|uniref:hypothetical protein n=1 Tax=Halobellus sp. H-GB7 TaxID=3069756 RepID=UPI0027AF31D8|nr:hypothetical protein [Halobellus sp. H-GB7]MDQ2056141.1 hypothetical protein [Halobellus sp. H-GB7]
MTETMSTTAASERSYRRAHGVLSGLSGLALGVLIALDRPLLGVVGFVAFLGAAGYLRVSYAGTLFDERDERTHERAAGWTLALFGWASAVFFPTLTALVALGYTTWPTWLTPIALTVPVVYGAYGVLLLVARRRV